MIPKLCIFDRDSTICVSSKDESSPFYYILDHEHLIVKPNVKEAFKIIKTLQIPSVLATKQRCVSKGLIGRERLATMNCRLERLCEFEFNQIYIEEMEETKLNLYRKILLDNSRIDPQNIWLFDDSEDERTIAARLGISVFDGANLYDAVIKAFKLR